MAAWYADQGKTLADALDGLYEKYGYYAQIHRQVEALGILRVGGDYGGEVPVNVPPHHADAIAKRLSEIDIFNDIKRMDYDEAVKAGLIEVLGAGTDEKFLSVGRRDSKIRTWMPLAAQTPAAARANSREWFRQSMQMATPRFLPSSPSAQMTSAKPWVARPLLDITGRFSYNIFVRHG